MEGSGVIHSGGPWPVWTSMGGGQVGSGLKPRVTLEEADEHQQVQEGQHCCVAGREQPGGRGGRGGGGISGSLCGGGHGSVTITDAPAGDENQSGLCYEHAELRAPPPPPQQ